MAALGRLSRTEGQKVSINQLAARAGVKKATLHYNLRSAPESSRRISPDLIARLAEALPISAEELTRAAAPAGGYRANDGSPPSPTQALAAVRAVLSDKQVSEQDRREFAALLLSLVAGLLLRPQGAHDQPPFDEEAPESGKQDGGPSALWV